MDKGTAILLGLAGIAVASLCSIYFGLTSFRSRLADFRWGKQQLLKIGMFAVVMAIVFMGVVEFGYNFYHDNPLDWQLPEPLVLPAAVLLTFWAGYNLSWFIDRFMYDKETRRKREELAETERNEAVRQLAQRLRDNIHWLTNNRKRFLEYAGILLLLFLMLQFALKMMFWGGMGVLLAFFLIIVCAPLLIFWVVSKG